MSRKISHRALKVVLDYDPESGVFQWAVGHRLAGRVAGHKSWLGYVTINIDGKTYTAHRLAWFYVHGCWPRHQVDHINRNGYDNRIANLRDVPGWVNAQNRPSERLGRNGTRCKHLPGAHRVLGAWVSRIHSRRNIYELGTFESEEEAHLMYLISRPLFHKGFISHER